jgi:hypothetical protein
MKKLIARYIKLNKEVVLYEKIAIFLLATLGVYILYSIYQIGLDKSLSQIETFGVILSAVLVGKIAGRQIIHSELIIENARANSLAADTHFLMTIIQEMSNKTHFIQSCLLKNDNASAPETQTLITFLKDIAISYQVLKSKDSHQHLHGTTLVLIWNMSIHIENLKALSEMFTNPEKFNLQSANPEILLTKIRTTNLSLLNPALLAIDDVLVKLEQIDNEVRELRSTIDLPSKLREEYGKI